MITVETPAISMFPVKQLKPIEGFIPERVDYVLGELGKEGIWTTPLVVDNRYGLIMDGHHRHQAALSLGCHYVPAILWSYEEVEIYSLREDVNISLNGIIENLENKTIYPNKTVKHNFPFILKSDLKISIDDLKK